MLLATCGRVAKYASLRLSGSIKVSGKLPIYPSPKPTFCPKREVSVNVGLGEGVCGQFPRNRIKLPVHSKSGEDKVDCAAHPSSGHFCQF